MFYNVQLIPIYQIVASCTKGRHLDVRLAGFVSFFNITHQVQF